MTRGRGSIDCVLRDEAAIVSVSRLNDCRQHANISTHTRHDEVFDSPPTQKDIEISAIKGVVSTFCLYKKV